MGCWSESCLASGLQIDPGTACYAAVLSPSKGFTTPLVLGEYNDYGALENISDFYGQIPSDDGEWPNRETEDTKHIIFIRKDVYDTFGQITLDLPVYWTPAGNMVEVTTIDEKIAAYRASVGEALVEYLKVDATDQLARAVESRLFLQAFDYERTPVFFSKFLYTMLMKEADDPAYDMTAELNWLLDMHCIMIKTNLAFYELRKVLQPAPEGPQHGGASNVIAFNLKVNQIAQSIIDEYDN